MVTAYPLNHYFQMSLRVALLLSVYAAIASAHFLGYDNGPCTEPDGVMPELDMEQVVHYMPFYINSSYLR